MQPSLGPTSRPTSALSMVPDPRDVLLIVSHRFLEVKQLKLQLPWTEFGPLMLRNLVISAD